MLKNIIDEGQKFDFGKTSKFYAKHRDIYPEELFDRLHKIGIGTEGSQWLDLGTLMVQKYKKSAICVTYR